MTSIEAAMASMHEAVSTERLLDVSNMEEVGIKKPLASAIKTECLNTFLHDGVNVLTVVDDPLSDKPFRIGYDQRTKEQAAVIAYGILAHLRAESVTDPETEAAFDEVMTYLNIRSVKGQIPF